MGIYLTGDTHRKLDISKVITFAKTEGLTKEDYLIVLGDFGALWESYSLGCPDIAETDKEVIDFYESLPFTTLFVDGNHENHNALDRYDVEEWNGGKIHRLSKTVIHLMRGQVYSINNIKFFTFGGARSIDKAYRVENISWWEREIPSTQEFDEGIKNLEKNNFAVDYVLTHDVGTEYSKKLTVFTFNPDVMNAYFQRLETTFNLKFKHWYFGHYHVDIDLDDSHTCIFDKIIKVKED